jgi:hypothetical protein
VSTDLDVVAGSVWFAAVTAEGDEVVVAVYSVSFEAERHG